MTEQKESSVTQNDIKATAQSVAERETARKAFVETAVFAQAVAGDQRISQDYREVVFAEVLSHLLEVQRDSMRAQSQYDIAAALQAAQQDRRIHRA